MHHQLPGRAVIVGGVVVAHPLQDGAAAAGVRHHVVVGGAGGVVQVVAGGNLHGLLHAVGIVQDQPQERGGGEVRLVRVLVGGYGLLPALIGHVDAAGHARVVYAVQGRVGRGQADDFAHQPVRILVHVNAQELQIHRGHGGMPPGIGLGGHQHGVGLGEVIVPAEERVPVRRGGREGGAADLRIADGHGNQPLGNLPGDEADQLAVALHAALGHKVIQIEAALHLHRVHRAVQMRIIARPYLTDARKRRQLIPPQAPHRHAQGNHQHQHHRQAAQQDFLPCFHPSVLRINVDASTFWIVQADCCFVNIFLEDSFLAWQRRGSLPFRAFCSGKPCRYCHWPSSSRIHWCTSMP